jgi:hypothetical protein
VPIIALDRAMGGEPGVHRTARLDMWQWLKRRNMLPRGEGAPPSTAPQRRRQAGADQLLFDYLEERYAQTVVLTFEQIEDLLGSGLPEPARRDGGWWLESEAGTTGGGTRAWTLAGRTATPNLRAQTVTFERVS